MYKLPELPYDFNALEPVISAEIMELHYKKHHETYVKKLNEALEKYHDAESKKDLEKMTGLLQAIKFNGGGHLNHSIFWTNLTPDGDQKPHGELAAAIKEKFGSFDTFVEKMSKKTIEIQGSGWGWLVFSKETDSLCITTRPNQDPINTHIPLLGIDVWEHAYYLQYKNVRADYVKNIWKIVNWKNVEERYMNAKK